MTDRKHALSALSDSLKKAGISDIRYTLRETRRRTTAVRGGALLAGTDSDDLLVMIEGAFEGKHARCSFSGIPDVQTAAVLLRESALIAGGETAEKKENAAAAQKADAANISEEKETAKAPEGAACGKAQQTCAPGKKTGEQDAEGAAFLWESHEAVLPLLCAAEAAAKEIPETALCENCRYEQTEERLLIAAEDGSPILSDASGYHCMRAGVIAKKNGSTEYTGACRYGRSLSEIGASALLMAAAREAAGGLGGKSLPSGTYAAVLKNEVVAELLEAFLPAFYESRKKDGQSALSGCTKNAAADFLSLREDPRLSAGRVTRRFDDEGTPVCEKYLMRNGRLGTAPRRSPEKEGDGESTGNGFQPDPQSDVGTGVTNVILESDASHEMEEAELLKTLSDGLYVTAIDGTFAGTNVKRGDFSLIARGRVIRNGRVAEAFREVTIAADFFEMLRRVRAAGKEKAATPPDLSCVLAPSLLTEGLVVSGL